MVVLTITPYRGNHRHHQHWFHHTGLLHLTNVVVQGTLRTALEEDALPLRASSVVVRVRCYEAMNGKLNVLYEQAQEVWTKEQKEGSASSSDCSWTDLANLEASFRIVVPALCSGKSTVTFKSYGYRVWWQIEAVILHKHIPMQGSRKVVIRQIPLMSFASPPALAPSSLDWSSSLSNPNAIDSCSVTPAAARIESHPSLQYTISASSSSAGPNDALRFHCRLRRLDPTLVVRRIEISIHRYIQLNSLSKSSTTTTPSDDEMIMHECDLLDECSDHSAIGEEMEGSHDSFEARKKNLSSFPHHSRASRTASNTSPTFSKQAATSKVLAKGVTATSILSIESDDIIFGSNSTSEVVMTGVVPRTKSHHYSVGETMEGKLGSVSFTVSVKIYIKTRSLGVEVLRLAPLPFFLTAHNSIDIVTSLAASSRLLAISDAELRLFGPPALPKVPRSTTKDRARLSEGAAAEALSADNVSRPKRRVRISEPHPAGRTIDQLLCLGEGSSAGSGRRRKLDIPNDVAASAGMDDISMFSEMRSSSTSTPSSSTSHPRSEEPLRRMSRRSSTRSSSLRSRSSRSCLVEELARSRQTSLHRTLVGDDDHSSTIAMYSTASREVDYDVHQDHHDGEGDIEFSTPQLQSPSSASSFRSFSISVAAVSSRDPILSICNEIDPLDTAPTRPCQQPTSTDPPFPPPTPSASLSVPLLISLPARSPNRRTSSTESVPSLKSSSGSSLASTAASPSSSFFSFPTLARHRRQSSSVEPDGAAAAVTVVVEERRRNNGLITWFAASMGGKERENEACADTKCSRKWSRSLFRKEERASVQ